MADLEGEGAWRLWLPQILETAQDVLKVCVEDINRQPFFFFFTQKFNLK